MHLPTFPLVASVSCPRPTLPASGNFLDVAPQVTEPPRLVGLDEAQRVIHSLEYCVRRDIRARVLHEHANSAHRMLDRGRSLTAEQRRPQSFEEARHVEIRTAKVSPSADSYSCVIVERIFSPATRTRVRALAMAAIVRADDPPVSTSD